MKRRSLIIPTLSVRLVNSRPVEHVCLAARLNITFRRDLRKTPPTPMNGMPRHFVLLFEASGPQTHSLVQQSSRQSQHGSAGVRGPDFPASAATPPARHPAGSIRSAQAEHPGGAKEYAWTSTSGAPGWGWSGRGDREQEKRLELPLRIKWSYNSPR